jgi:hypothetical protein
MFRGNAGPASGLGVSNRFCWRSRFFFITAFPIDRRPSFRRRQSRIQQATKAAQRRKIDTRRFSQCHPGCTGFRHPDGNLERRGILSLQDKIDLVTEAVPPDHRRAFAAIRVMRIVNGDLGALILGSIPLF